MRRPPPRTSSRLVVIVAAIPLLVAGCDPIVNIAGANFPSWLVASVAGALMAAMVRPIFVVFKVERYLWPAPVVYISLAALLGCGFWITFFNRI